MTRLLSRTKNDTKTDMRDKPKVYFTCHPDDFDKSFGKICEDIFRTQDCVIFYKENMADTLPEETRQTDLERMNLFVFPVTFRMMTDKDTEVLRDLEFAKKNLKPILPIMFEPNINGRLTGIYNSKKLFGKRQFLRKYNNDITEISYEQKLEKFLKSTLFSKEIVEVIRKAFDAYIFLSYRKKDRKYANDLIKLIHSDPSRRNIAIWFDEFLEPGENFSDAIKKAIHDSRFITLLVTPNLLEDPNYVMKTEYPAALKAQKPVYPVEKIHTDRQELSEKYKDLPEVVDIKDEHAFESGYLEAVKGIAKNESDDDPMHSYLMGMAYLNGIDVEFNAGYGVELMTKAGESGLFDAMVMLYTMYFNGANIELDYDKALYWVKKAYEYCKVNYDKKNNKTIMMLRSLEMAYEYAGDYEGALRFCEESYDLYRKEFGDADECTVSVLLLLAKAKYECGHYDEALALYEKARKYSDNDNEHLLAVLSGIGAAYYHKDDHRKALEMTEKCFEMACEVYGGKAAVTLRQLGNLADCYLALGECEKALEKQKRCYDLYREVLGEDSFDTLVQLTSLALIYGDMKDYKTSLRLSKESLRRMNRVLCGKDHPAMIAPREQIALINRKLGNYKEALSYQKKAYDSLNKFCGRKHPDTQQGRMILMVIYHDLGENRKFNRLKKEYQEIESENRRQDHSSPKAFLNMPKRGS